jgi:hypothetical protein
MYTYIHSLEAVNILGLAVEHQNERELHAILVRRTRRKRKTHPRGA